MAVACSATLIGRAKSTPYSDKVPFSVFVTFVHARSYSAFSQFWTFRNPGLNRGNYRQSFIRFALRRRAMHMNYSASRLLHATSLQLLQDHHLWPSHLFGHVSRTYHERQMRQLLLVTPTGKRHWSRPSTKQSDYICNLAWSSPGVQPSELSEIAVDGARGISSPPRAATCPSTLPWGKRAWELIKWIDNHCQRIVLAQKNINFCKKNETMF